MRKMFATRLLSFIAACLLCVQAQAAYVLQVDTSSFVSTPVSLAFDLIDGAPGRTTISFDAPIVDGVVSGSGGEITDNSFYQAVSRPITLGDQLVVRFNADLFEEPSADFLADSLAIYLIGQDWAPLFSTSDPVGADSLLQWDVGRSSPSVFFGELHADGVPSSIPEPGTLWLLLPLLGLVVLIQARRTVLVTAAVCTLSVGIQAAPTLDGSTDLGSQVQANASGLVFNRGTSTFDSNVVIRNTSTVIVPRPLTVVILSLPAGVVLTNATAVADEGAPFVTLDGSSSISPGASISVPLKFVNRTNAAFRFDIRVVRLNQAVSQLAFLLGPDANANDVRDDLEPLLVSRYGASPALQSAALGVLATMRNALGATGSVETAFDSALKLNKALDCMIDTAGLEQGITENKLLRDQMLNTRERIETWIARMTLLAGQSVPVGNPNPCAGN